MTEEELSHSKSIEQQLPLLITKLSIIRDNYNNSIEKRKQKIKEREKEIELHEQKHKLTPSIITYNNNNNNHSHRQYCSLSRNSNHFNSNKDIVSSNNNIKNIKHIKSTSSLTHYQNFLIKPTSKIGLYMSKTTSKFNLKKSSSAFNLNDATCSIDKSNRNASSSVGFQRQHSFNISHSPKNQISHNNNNNKTKRATVNFSLQTCKKQQQQHIVPTSKKYINQNVYHLPIDTLQKLKKLQLQKKEHSLKDYHESLISLGKVLLNKDNVKKLNKKFHRIRKDTNVKLGNTKQFLRWIEYKEEKIVNKINKIGQQATFLLNALQVKNPARFVKKIKFETVMK